MQHYVYAHVAIRIARQTVRQSKHKLAYVSQVQSGRYRGTYVVHQINLDNICHVSLRGGEYYVNLYGN